MAKKETYVDNRSQRVSKVIVVVSIQIPVALLHFVTGPNYRGPAPIFVNSYLIDILLPFAVYFLLCMNEYGPLKQWFVKALLVFAIGVSVEVAQYFGAPLLGRTFDPVDFVMYGLGVLLAALVDMMLFARVFAFWRPEANLNSKD
jgi:hypothetical protein